VERNLKHQSSEAICSCADNPFHRRGGDFVDEAWNFGDWWHIEMLWNGEPHPEKVLQGSSHRDKDS
jgi:hypothetical protein